MSWDHYSGPFAGQYTRFNYTLGFSNKVVIGSSADVFAGLLFLSVNAAVWSITASTNLLNYQKQIIITPTYINSFEKSEFTFEGEVEYTYTERCVIYGRDLYQIGSTIIPNKCSLLQINPTLFKLENFGGVIYAKANVDGDGLSICGPIPSNPGAIFLGQEAKIGWFSPDNGSESYMNFREDGFMLRTTGNGTIQADRQFTVSCAQGPVTINGQAISLTAANQITLASGTIDLGGAQTTVVQG